MIREANAKQASQLDELLAEEIESIREAGLWRECATLDSPPGPRITIGGREYLHLCSNNYLDLAGHPELARAAAEAAAEWGTGAGSARLVTGTCRLAEDFERELAEFKSAEAALLFSSGYLANIGLITGLARSGDWLICDRLNHASLIDAARLSRAHVHTYAHGDAEAAARILSDTPTHARKFIVTDGVFSMDGDLAPLAALSELAEKRGAWLVVDDAHGTGVIGPEGRGSLASLGLRGNHLIQIVTLSKALGSQGGAVVGSRRVIEVLINRARPFVFETALAPPAIAAARAALRIIQREPHRIDQLQRNVRFVREGLARLGLEVPNAETPIFPLLVGSNERALNLSTKFRAAGFWLTAIRPPTVPEGTARLRLTVMSSHEIADLQNFINTAGQILIQASPALPLRTPS